MSQFPYNSLTTILVFTGLVMGMFTFVLGLIESYGFLNANENGKVARNFSIQAVCSSITFVFWVVTAARPGYIQWSVWLHFFAFCFAGFFAALNLLELLRAVQMTQAKVFQLFRIFGWFICSIVAMLAFKYLTPIWWDQLFDYISSLF